MLQWRFFYSYFAVYMWVCSWSRFLECWVRSWDGGRRKRSDVSSLLQPHVPSVGLVLKLQQPHGSPSPCSSSHGTQVTFSSGGPFSLWGITASCCGWPLGALLFHLGWTPCSAWALPDAIAFCFLSIAVPILCPFSIVLPLWVFIKVLYIV